MRIVPLILSASALLLTASAARAQSPTPAIPPAYDEAARGETASASTTTGETDAGEAPYELADSEIIEIVDRTAPGSVQAVGAAELERFEYNDVHQVLASVPGVYVRQEDGYGLRPNIGMRGASGERSAKISLMEDGVLIAPAPYSAPAAYYFPLVTRMERVEVLKGPSAIVHGPNTVGGSVNLISKSFPQDREFTLDLAGGLDRYGKVHATYGETRDHIAVLVEALKLRTDGFKELDSGGSTGFDKNDVSLKVRLQTDRDRDIYQRLDLKLGYSDEVSDETYTGLTDTDFESTPYRRYAGTQLDRMDWQHTQAQLTHHVEFFDSFQLDTTVYRNEFVRDWRKLNSFADARPTESVLASPDAGNNAVLYAVLTGQADSTSASEALLIGTNAREFISQGVQVTGSAERRVLGTDHDISVGVRYHSDAVARFHTEEEYFMTGGALVRTETEMAVTRDASAKARALAAYARDKVQAGPVTVSAGVRAELIETEVADRMAFANEDLDGSYIEATHSVVIPGAGVVYQALPSLGLLAGVHKGFVPVAPGQSPDIAAEESINYEAGARYASRWLVAEAIGFFSDYSNLKGTCTASSGCSSAQIGDEFNGGEVHVLGLELLAGAEIPAFRALRLPVQASYTFTRSRFQSGFTSDNPIWGDVEVDDELPYVPPHQIAVQAGAAGKAWDSALSVRYVSAMRDRAGQGDAAPDETSDAAWTVDLAASYAFGPWGTAYVTVDNLLDQAHVVSRRPYGARPGKPRIVILGYKNRF